MKRAQPLETGPNDNGALKGRQDASPQVLFNRIRRRLNATDLHVLLRTFACGGAGSQEACSSWRHGSAMIRRWRFVEKRCGSGGLSALRASDGFLAPLQGAVVITPGFPGVALVSLAYPWLFSQHASGVQDSWLVSVRVFGVKRIASRFKLRHYLSRATAFLQAAW